MSKIIVFYGLLDVYEITVILRIISWYTTLKLFDFYFFDINANRSPLKQYTVELVLKL